MIRKSTAYLLMILANIVLLAHAVVPHHHHHEQVCTESACCQEDVLNHEHNLPEDNHRHDDSKNTGTCILKQAIALPSNLGKQELRYNASTDTPSYFFLFVLNVDASVTGCTEERTTAFAPVSIFSYTKYVTCSAGLRAPPTV